MKSLSLNAKITFILSIFVLASIVISVLGLSKMSELNESVNAIVEKNVPRIVFAKSLDADTNEIKNQEKTMILEKNPEGMNKISAEIDKIETHAREMLRSLDKVVAESARPEIAQAISLLDTWKTISLDIRKLTLADKNEEAFALSRGSSKETLDKFDAIMKNVTERNTALLDAEVKRTDELYENSRTVILSVSAIAIFFGLFSAFLILRSLSRTIDEVINGLNDSSTQVTSAAHQIAASSEQLSQGATEQASSLEETSSAVEEMTSMVQRNADSAQESLKSSQSSGESANRGKKVVEDMKRAMIDIDNANVNIMNQTNESNVKISEIVKVIAEIGNKTKVINDIVFQTKLLSFNASVEAARAGEHGKGFAVVAEEVGNLAQMSGNAAKEISNMLDSSIQKVENIVRDTKTSVERLISESKAKVELGNRVAADCGNVLEEIVGKVNTVFEMSNSISTASNEQARGISEINNAVTQLDQMTQQNAAVSEEAASAAEELSSQAQSMQNIVKTLILTIKGGDGEVAAQRNVATPRKRDTTKTVSRPEANRKGNVVHLGAKRPKAKVASNSSAHTLRMASGGDVIPSEDDPRFKDI